MSVSCHDQFSFSPTNRADSTAPSTSPSPPKGCLSKDKNVIIFLLIAMLIIAGVAVAAYYLLGQNERPDLTEDDLHSADIRLPTSVTPIYYKLDLIPFIEEKSNFSLQGKVWIDVKCVRETSKITVHVKNLKINTASVFVAPVLEAEIPVFGTEKPKGSISVEKHEFDQDKDLYRMTLKSELKKGGVYRLFMEYTGVIDTKMQGFYRSSYFNKDATEKRYIAATHFEATHARKAFPCFDEPALTAKFEVSVGRRTNMSSLSNMELSKEEPISGTEGWVWDHYKKSVPMSTYLVAVVVMSNFKYVSSRGRSKAEVKVWARKDVLDQVKYAADIAPRLLTFYENYFGIDYPLPKLDLIAIPELVANGIENWGLITFKESSLLLDSPSSSELHKERVTLTVSHAIAHQWFGNLVTPKWWDDHWLTEGFARYTEYFGVAQIDPDWKPLEKFVVHVFQDSLRHDALDSSHPISSGSVKNPSQISQIFEEIPCGKVASILRMINHGISDASYKKGLQNYLQKWSYKAVTQTDLWEVFTDQAHWDQTLPTNVTIQEIMNSWTLQNGFPLITATRNYTSGGVTFNQTKFRICTNSTGNYDTHLWWVPITYTSKSPDSSNSSFLNTTPSFWLTPKTPSITPHNLTIAASRWLIVNLQETGFYRVNYDLQNWRLIIDELLTEPTSISVINRAQIIDDSFNLARAGYLDYSTPFEITLYLRDDNDYLPWEAFGVAIKYVGDMLSRSAVYGSFKGFIQQLIFQQYYRLGFIEREDEEETALEKRHRFNVVSLGCHVGQKTCVGKAVNYFQEWRNLSNPDKNNPIPINLRKVIYCTAIKNGGQNEWDFLWERYLRCDVAHHKNEILFGLTCSKDQWVLIRLLEWGSSEGQGIRKQDGPTVMEYVAVQDVGYTLVLKFLREKWLELKEYFGGSFDGLGKVFGHLSSKLNTQVELEKLEQFRSQYKAHLGAATRAVEEAVETVRGNVRWMESYYDVVSKWLENQTGGERKWDMLPY